MSLAKKRWWCRCSFDVHVYWQPNPSFGIQFQSAAAFQWNHKGGEEEAVMKDYQWDPFCLLTFQTLSLPPSFQPLLHHFPISNRYLAVFLPRDNLRNIFTSCVDYRWKMAWKNNNRRINGTFFSDICITSPVSLSPLATVIMHTIILLLIVVNTSKIEAGNLKLNRSRLRSKTELCLQNLTPKTSHILHIPPNFLKGFTLISKMVSGAPEAVEIRQSAEKSHLC